MYIHIYLYVYMCVCVRVSIYACLSTYLALSLAPSFSL